MESLPQPLLEVLLEPFPSEVQNLFRQAKDRARIINPEDPFYQMLIVLNLYAAFYQKIPERVIEAAKQIAKGNEKATSELQQRVELLQGLSQAINQSTERLSHASNEIVDKFPVEQIAKSVGQRVDRTLESLPLASFERQVAAAQTTMARLADTAAASANAVNESTARINRCAQELKATDLPFMSFWSNAGFTLVGAAVTWLMMWLIVVRPLQDNQPDMKKVAELLRNEAYIGYSAVAGYTNDEPVIMVPPSKLRSYNVDEQGNLLVHLNKPAQ